MPTRNNKKRQSKAIDGSKAEDPQPPGIRTQHIPPPTPNHISAAPSMERAKPRHKNVGLLTDDRASKVDTCHSTAHNATTAAPTLIQVAPHASDLSLELDKGKASVPQAPNQLTSLRLATSQTNAETARLQDVLDGKKAELQVLKERLRVLTGGSKNGYARRMKVVRRGVEGRRGEVREVMER